MYVVYKNNVLPFEELELELELDKLSKIYHRNIQSFSMELFKIKNNLSVAIHCFFITNAFFQLSLSVA